MKKLCLSFLLLSSGFLFAQNSASHATLQQVKDSKGQKTVQGCVSRSGGDYTLIKQNPPMTYELQGAHGVKLRDYLGQRVEVTGRESTTMSSSSDAINKTGGAASTTLTVTAIRTIDNDCTVR